MGSEMCIRDRLHISTLRSETDSDREALDKLIARLDKLSLMGSADDLKDENKIRRMHSAIAQEKWTYIALCKLPVIYSYEDMVSILRKSITDLSAFDRQRKKVNSTVNSTPPSQPVKPPDQPSPWSSDSSSSAPPPLDALFTRSGNKRTCFNCEKEGCLLGKCPEPMNLRRISENLEKFKKNKSDRTNNPKWKSKRVYLSELQPSIDEWPDVYEVIVSEALLCQHGMDISDKGECPNAFSVTESDKDPIKEAFQVSVGDGDPDECDSNFTSLFDLMTTPPDMDQDIENPISIDFAEYMKSNSSLEWNVDEDWSPDLVPTSNFGSVTILKHVGIQ